MLLTINNPSLENAERTLLTDPVSSGATTLAVKSSQGFSANQYVIVGNHGSEKTEMVLESALPTALTMTVAALSYAHNEGDPVTYARYNQIKIYKATSLTGTYTEIGASPIDIDVDNPDLMTVYDDTTGLSTDYYKITYYNSQTTLESSYSDPIPGSGVETTTVRYVTDQVLKEVQDMGENFTDRQEIMDWFNDCSADVMSRRRKWPFLLTRAVSTRTADRGYYTLSTDFGITDMDKISHLVHYYNDGVSVTEYRLRYIQPWEFDRLTETADVDATTDDATQRWTYDEAMDYIRVYPIPDTTQTSAYYLYYYKDIPQLDSDGDEFAVDDTRIYKFYAIAQFWNKKGDSNRSDRYLMKYEAALSQLVRSQRKEAGQPIGFTFSKEYLRRWFKY